MSCTGYAYDVSIIQDETERSELVSRRLSRQIQDYSWICNELGAGYGKDVFCCLIYSVKEMFFCFLSGKFALMFHRIMTIKEGNY